jgi:flagellar biosynthesis protein FliR
MHHYNLSALLQGHIYAFVLIFCRLGSMMMLFPGIGEIYVAPRFRLMFAFSLSFLMMPVLMPRLPGLPPEIPALTGLIFYEIVVGLFFGTFLRLLMGALETAGTVIALQTGLSNATILNPAQASQSPLPSAFLSIAGVTLVFVMGIDHMLLRSMVATYDLFPPGGELMPGDMAQMVTHIMSRSFTVGIELAMPFIIMGLLMFLALGLMQRLMPVVQLFLIVMPLQIWGGLFLMSVTVAAIMTAWLHYFDTSMTSFFTR